MKNPVVYFLCDGPLVVYVGQSINLDARLATHITDKEFSTVLYKQSTLETLDQDEEDAIREYRPLLNRTFVDVDTPYAERLEQAKSDYIYNIVCNGDSTNTFIKYKEGDECKYSGMALTIGYQRIGIVEEIQFCIGKINKLDASLLPQLVEELDKGANVNSKLLTVYVKGLMEIGLYRPEKKPARESAAFNSPLKWLHAYMKGEVTTETLKGKFTDKSICTIKQSIALLEEYPETYDALMEIMDFRQVSRYIGDFSTTIVEEHINTDIQAHFKVGHYYTKSEVKQFMADLYSKYGVTKIAKSTELKKYIPCYEKCKRVNGTNVKVIWIGVKE